MKMFKMFLVALVIFYKLLAVYDMSVNAMELEPKVIKVGLVKKMPQKVQLLKVAYYKKKGAM